MVRKPNSVLMENMSVSECNLAREMELYKEKKTSSKTERDKVAIKGRDRSNIGSENMKMQI